MDGFISTRKMKRGKLRIIRWRTILIAGESLLKESRNYLGNGGSGGFQSVARRRTVIPCTNIVFRFLTEGFSSFACHDLPLPKHTEKIRYLNRGSIRNQGSNLIEQFSPCAIPFLKNFLNRLIENNILLFRNIFSCENYNGRGAPIFILSDFR